jgi:hypothetical protein
MASIVISYRREDSAGYAGRIFDRLQVAFGGKHEVFMDIDTLQYGDDFVETIEQIVSSCQVVIAVIGKQWLALLDERERSGLEDYVRLEIQTALDRKIRVIPALIGGAHAQGRGASREDGRACAPPCRRDRRRWFPSEREQAH